MSTVSSLEEKIYSNFNEKLDQGMIAMLLKYGVEVVAIEFSGSGDSGDINNVQYSFNPKFDHLKEERKNYLGSLDNSAWNNVLSFIEYDWYNNEGGYGTLYLDIPNGKFAVEGGYYVTETQDSSHGSMTPNMEKAQKNLGL